MFSCGNAVGLEVAAERLLHDHAPEAAPVLRREPRCAEPLADLAEELGRGREVEEVVPARAALLVEARADPRQLLVGLPPPEVALDVLQALLEPGPALLVERGGGLDEAPGLLAQERAEARRVELLAAHADHHQLVRQQPALPEVVERGDELALREVAGGPEDDEDGRPGRPFVANGLAPQASHGCPPGGAGLRTRRLVIPTPRERPSAGPSPETTASPVPRRVPRSRRASPTAASPRRCCPPATGSARTAPP